MHIGIIGPVNPADLQLYLYDKKVMNVNNASTSVTTYIKELCQTEHEVSVFSFYPNNTNNIVEYHGERLHLYMVSSSSPIPMFGYPFRIHRLRKVLNQHFRKLDVLHAQWTYDYAYVAKDYIGKVPVFCSVRDWCPIMKKSMQTLVSKMDWIVKEWLFKKVIAEPQMIFFANSDFTMQMLKEYCPTNEIYFVPNPIQKEHILRERNVKLDHPIFISIAQGVSGKNKNNIVLAQAFSEIQKDEPKAELWFVGSTDEHGVVESYVRENSVENVTFWGSMNHEKIFELLDKSTCLVHPSLNETFGNVFLEAMARRVPCIGGDKSGGVPMVLDYGKNGLLCDVTDVGSLVSVMKMSLRQENLNHLIENATTKLLTTYSSDINMQNIIAIYNKHVK